MSAENLLEDGRLVVGSADNFFLWSPQGWDLTHPSSPSAVPIEPRVSLQCALSPVTFDPAKTALVIIDMQNFSMSTAIIGNDYEETYFAAQDVLLRLAIPAARKLNLQIIWLNWGLTDEDLKTITPGAARVFSFTSQPAEDQKQAVKGPQGERPTGLGPGVDLGRVTLDDGQVVDAGRALMRGTWNAELHGPLLPAFHQGQSARRPDVLVHKNRNSGLWDSSCDCMQYLKTTGIRTLLFAGMNTDQCVMGTLQDAHHRGFDTIMLQDACATNSPTFAQDSAVYNCRRAYGFLSSCEALAAAADQYG
ncbi:isochorismatase family protein [Trichoderma sp. SZMC 28014]